MRTTNLGALASISTFLEEARLDPLLFQKVTTHGDHKIGTQDVNIIGWVEARAAGHNLFRVKFAPASAASGHRVICGFDWRAQRLGILAAADRGDLDEYAIDSDLAKRILVDWREATGGQRTY